MVYMTVRLYDESQCSIETKMEFFVEMDIPAMDMASDICRVVLAGIVCSVMLAA